MPDDEYFYHVSEIDSVMDYLQTTNDGLSQFDADDRLLDIGNNELKRESKEGPLTLLLSQFKDFIVIILIFASFISLLFGDSLDFIAILIILLLNAFLGFYQEYKAERSLDALQSLTAPHARVLRDKVINSIDAKNLVPGDIILLEAGDVVPADARLLSSFNLHIDESALTGESSSVLKDANELMDINTEISDQVNMLFMGTNVVRGNCIAVVVKTGMKTVVGNITTLLSEADERDTPLKQKMNEFGKQIGWIILAICGVVVVLGTVAQNTINFDVFIEMLIVGVALAVAAVPEGLPAVITVALSIGVIKMSRQKAIVRKLESVETLGSTTVICTDKTGTLTQNKMMVEKILVAPFYDSESVSEGNSDQDNFSSAVHSMLYETASLCNNASFSTASGEVEILGEPTEAALLWASYKAGFSKPELERKNKRIFEFPFDSDRKLMSTINKIQTDEGEVYRLFVKGAPDVVKNLCQQVLMNKQSIEPLTVNIGKNITQQERAFGSEALRILSFAYRDLSEAEVTEILHKKEIDYGKYERALIFIGLMAMHDPPRPEAIEAIKTANRAGVRVIMITGDHKNTAIAIGKQMGLLQENEEDLVLTGKELRTLNQKQLREKVKSTKIFARVNPEHKLQIVSALQDNKEIVAVTGDGVNDAPALKQADIGVAMGETGTDVAKQASDMVLIDDNFATLELAIEEGRGIYANMKKFISYLLACNTGEVMTIFLGILILMVIAPGLPFRELLPLTALQLLYINLLTDGLPALALGVDPKEPNVMDQDPRNPNEPIFNIHMNSSILLAGSIVGLGTLFLFFWYLNIPGGYQTWVTKDPITNVITGGTIFKAQTMAFTVLIFFQKAMALSSRSERDSIFKIGLFSNKYLWGALLLTASIHLSVIYWPPLQEIFKTVPLSLGDWIVILTMAISVFAAEEIRKFVFRSKGIV